MNRTSLPPGVASAPMDVSVQPSPAERVRAYKERYRAEAGCQIYGDSALGRGIADPWLVSVAGAAVGYGAVWNRYHKGAVVEFYVEPDVRDAADALFGAFARAAGASHAQAQTNLRFCSALFRRHAVTEELQHPMFGDWADPELGCPGQAFEFAEVPNPSPNHPDSRDYAMRVGGEVVASGGYLCHYNPPYADVHMEVVEGFRGRGWGSLFVQQVARAALANGKVPGARCNPANLASWRTLERGGFRVVGLVLLCRLGLGM